MQTHCFEGRPAQIDLVRGTASDGSDAGFEKVCSPFVPRGLLLTT
jgi:hypothetical protein